MFNGPFFDSSARPPDRFHDRLYISDANTASRKEELKKHGITHVLSAVGITPPHPGEFQYLVLQIEDSEFEDLVVHFPKCHEFIDAALAGGGAVLIHCAAGISRSSTVCISYLMVRHGMQFEDAFARSARPIVFPNRGFRQQLQLYHDMKFNAVGDTPAHRQYRFLRVYCACRQRRPESEFEAHMAPDPAFAATPPAATVYSCAECKRRLFTEDSILSVHEGGACNIAPETYALEPIKWMKDWPTEGIMGSDGPLKCPGCDTKLGTYFWKDKYRCSCGKLWVPTTRVEKAKVVAEKGIKP